MRLDAERELECVQGLRIDVPAVAGHHRLAPALPGMRRGMKKFIVIAAQSVTTKKPSLRRMNLTTRASCR